jgi:hypothetical protein
MTARNGRRTKWGADVRWNAGSIHSFGNPSRFFLAFCLFGLICVPPVHGAEPHDGTGRHGTVNGGLNIPAEYDSPAVKSIVDYITSQRRSEIDLSGLDPRHLDALEQASVSPQRVLESIFGNQSFVLVFKDSGDVGESKYRELEKILLLSRPNPNLRSSQAPDPSAHQRPMGASPEEVASGSRDSPGGPDGIAALLDQIAFAKGAAPPLSGEGDGEHEQDEDRAGIRDDRPKGLASDGAVLDTLNIDPSDVRLTKEIDLGSDVPLETYVMRHAVAGSAQQRTASGDWIPWDGREETLTDNGFAPVNGRLEFDIAQGDLSNELFPISYSVAYRSDSGLKFGVFQVMPRAAAFN